MEVKRISQPLTGYEKMLWDAQEKVLCFPAEPEHTIDIIIEGPIEEEPHIIDIKV